MYATIRRYHVNAGSTEHLAEAGWRLGAELTRVFGFVALLTIDADQGDIVVISLFDDHASLVRGATLIEHWCVEHIDSLRAGPIEVTAGEVVAQKGL